MNNGLPKNYDNENIQAFKISHIGSANGTTISIDGQTRNLSEFVAFRSSQIVTITKDGTTDTIQPWVVTGLTKDLDFSINGPVLIQVM